jgi:hypothetical protein
MTICFQKYNKTEKIDSNFDQLKMFSQGYICIIIIQLQRNQNFIANKMILFADNSKILYSALYKNCTFNK